VLHPFIFDGVAGGENFDLRASLGGGKEGVGAFRCRVSRLNRISRKGFYAGLFGTVLSVYGFMPGILAWAIWLGVLVSTGDAGQVLINAPP